MLSFMALSAATRRASDAIQRLMMLLSPKSRDIVYGLLAIGSILFVLTSQPPIVTGDGTSQVIVASQVETETMHVILKDGSYSTHQSSETTVATTTKE